MALPHGFVLAMTSKKCADLGATCGIPSAAGNPWTDAGVDAARAEPELPPYDASKDEPIGVRRMRITATTLSGTCFCEADREHTRRRLAYA